MKAYFSVLLAASLLLTTPAFAAFNADTGSSAAGGSAYFGDSGGTPTVTPSVSSSTDGLAIGSGAKAITGARAIAIGKCYASGDDSICIQTTNSTSSFGAQGQSAIAIGASTLASGTSSVSMGFSATSNGNYATVIGANSSSTADYATTFGYRASGFRYGALTQAAGRFASTGDAQAGRAIFRIATTDATQTTMTLDGVPNASTVNRFGFGNNTSNDFTIRLVARDSSGNTATWRIEGSIKRGSNNGSTALVGTATGTGSPARSDAGASAWLADVAADTTNGALSIRVTGAAATAINWVASCDFVEVVK